MVNEAPNLSEDGLLVHLPQDLPDGRALVAEGREIGRATETGESAFCAEYGVKSEVEFRATKAEEGELTWGMVMGLSSVEEQLDGLRYLHELGRKTGMPIHRGLVIPNLLTALPPAMREKAPKGTSFILDGLEDHVRIAQAAPIQPSFADSHIGSPYCVDNTVAAIQAGATYHGSFSQMAWDPPLFKDDVAHIAETIKAVGVVAGKRREWHVVDSYPEDGFGGHFLDHASLVGYAMLEKYIIDDLCGARYSLGFGGLTSDVFTKVSVCLALNAVLRADHPCISFVFGNTLAPSDSYVVQNFGVIASENGVFGAAERRYRTGLSLLPIPITEKIAVPTREAIGEARLVAGRAADPATGLDKLIDWSVVEAQREVLVENGKKFYANALRVLGESGIDVGDPLQVCLAVRRIGASKLEALCHPGERDPSRPNGIIPFVPTELLLMTEEAVRAEVENVRSKGLADSVVGRRFVVAAADIHWFGSYALKAVLGELGAEVAYLGAERDPEQVVAAAEREGWPAIAVSTHNGQCLAYGEHLMALLAECGKKCPVYLGGKLNGICEGDTEPSDMTQRLRDMGIVPCASVAELVEQAADGGLAQ